MNCFVRFNTLWFWSLVSLFAKCLAIDCYYSENTNHSLFVDNQMTDLSLKIVTWNVKGEQPKCDLSQLLDIKSEAKSAPNECGHGLADIYGVGFQEVSLRPQNIFYNDPWIDSLDSVFKQLDYIRLKSVRLVGILLVVYTRRQHLPRFRSIETQYTPTGFGGFFGNKGGVSISVVVDGISICLVNSHLYPHLEHLEQRIADYNTIIDGQMFVSTRKPNILSHDYVIWLGDLNFRIDDLTNQEVHDIIMDVAHDKSSNYSKLLEKDQLIRVRREGRAFSEFSESEPRFAPTYKFIVNTDHYDYKGQPRSRKPAFTDRVLYRFTANAYENFVLDLKQLEYKSYPQYKQSDHKPVSALFQVKTKRTPVRTTLSKRSVDTTDQMLVEDIEKPLVVTFHPMRDWKVNRDSTAWYTVSPNDDQSIARMSPWDWIGLYKADFLSLEEQMAFVWANPVPKRWSAPSDTSAAEAVDGQSQSRPAQGSHEPWFSVQFSDQSLLISDQFRLVYVSESGDVLGMSDPFVVSL